MQLTIYSTKYPCFTIDIDILDELLTVEHIKYDSKYKKNSN